MQTTISIDDSDDEHVCVYFVIYLIWQAHIRPSDEDDTMSLMIEDKDEAGILDVESFHKEKEEIAKRHANIVEVADDATYLASLSPRQREIETFWANYICPVCVFACSSI